jgi:hypothetical protein
LKLKLQKRVKKSGGEWTDIEARGLALARLFLQISRRIIRLPKLNQNGKKNKSKYNKKENVKK